MVKYIFVYICKHLLIKYIINNGYWRNVIWTVLAKEVYLKHNKKVVFIGKK